MYYVEDNVERPPQKTCTINDSKRIYYSVMQGTGLVVLPAEQARYGRLPGENIISRRKLRRRRDYERNVTPKSVLNYDDDDYGDITLTLPSLIGKQACLAFLLAPCQRLFLLLILIGARFNK